MEAHGKVPREGPVSFLGSPEAKETIKIVVGETILIRLNHRNSRPFLMGGCTRVLRLESKPDLRRLMSERASPLWTSSCRTISILHVQFTYFTVQGVRTQMWTLVGAHIPAFGSRGLGVSTFPWGRVTDTLERRSRHLSFYDP
ncbi:hypothetical protein CRG98_032899 [Punica granatum]|uniref:Uncharacterized protein n=1 Tax=Punica granatum TaxID=22663 RepID=A0A2I0IRU3_PUNGR|nr:hypothetical protein CRG98_032899 [Punica granatum]